MSELQGRIRKATGWSTLTEVTARLAGFVSSIVLARLLTPEAFGVVATVTMVVTFAELFTDAGFQKYIIQHEFRSAQEREENTQVAFWTNLALSLLLWGVIALLRNPLARLLGAPGLGSVIAIACVSIPLAAFSSIQAAGFKRDLDFKPLFVVRMAGTLIPLLVTIPLALWLRSYWALVAGTILTNLVSAVLLTVFSKWKPRRYFSFAQLREMLSFSVWSMVEAVSIWLTAYADIFIVGACLSQHLLGVYKTSMSVVGQFTGIVTAATTPILFSALSRLQRQEGEFKAFYLKFQKAAAMVLIPLGAGIFLFRNLVTGVMLGAQWGEAAGFIGIWGLTSAFAIVLGQYCSEAFRAKGRPRLSVLAQWLYIAAFIPVLLIFVRRDFVSLYWARALVRFVSIAVNMFLLWRLVRIRPGQSLLRLVPELLAAGVMAVAALLLRRLGGGLGWDLLSVVLCALVYGLALLPFREERSWMRIACRRLLERFGGVLPDALYLRLWYRVKMGQKLHLRHPRTFNEKLQWLKLHDRKTLYTRLADKAEVKVWAAERIGPEHLNSTIGLWERAEEIDFDALPEQFVLKTTHDCGGVVICKDRASLDREAVRAQLAAALSRNFYALHREWPYKDIKPRILAEPYLEDASGELIDYKFFCFSGKPELMFIATGRQGPDETRFDFFDMEFRHLPFTNGHPNADVTPAKPSGWEEMKRLAARLSEGIPQVRVDFYEVDGRVLLGEMTFFHWSGLVPFDPPEWDRKLGDLITL
ncbi:MAG: oligosaccharide flippase family protein [Bacteroidales bacterium]|nr:oligosaccharide flippase family protein [Bacteroidales bacterium]